MDTRIIENMTIEEFRSKMEKINSNFKNYKREWCFSVKQENDIFIISASNKYRFIAYNRGNFDEFMKVMKIKVTEQGDHLLLEKSFKFNLFDFIIIKFIPISFCVLFLANGMYILLSLFLNKNINNWFKLSEYYLGLFALTDLIWTRKSRKLEIDRYQIIEEILQRHFPQRAL